MLVLPFKLSVFLSRPLLSNKSLFILFQLEVKMRAWALEGPMLLKYRYS